MKIKVNKNELFKALTCCSSIISAKPLIPITESVLMETKGNILKLRTTDISSEVSYTIKLKEEPTESFKAVIPCILLLNAIKLIREEEISLNAIVKESSDQVSVLIKSKKGQCKIEGQEVSAFPKEKLDQEVDKFFSFKHLNGVNDLSNVLSFVEAGDIRPQLSHVNMKLEKGILKAIGMSNHSGATQYLEVNNSFDLEFDDVSVHKDIISKLFKLTLNSGMKFSVVNKMFVAVGDNFKFAGDTYTETKYPDVSSIYENKMEDYIIINPRELRDSILRVSNFSEFAESAKLLNLDITNSFSNIVVHSENFSGSSEETNDVIGENINFVKKDEKEVRVRLNSVYLLNILNSTQKPIRLYLREITDQTYCKGLLFVSEGDIKEGEPGEGNNESPSEKRFILMPTV